MADLLPVLFNRFILWESQTISFAHLKAINDKSLNTFAHIFRLCRVWSNDSPSKPIA